LFIYENVSFHLHLRQVQVSLFTHARQGIPGEFFTFASDLLSHLFGIGAKTAMQIIEGQMIIKQGDIYWVPLEEPDGLEPGYIHPHVVIQDNVFNRSRIKTVVVCGLTTNIKRAKAPGNVLLETGEANLPKQSVVVVSQVSTVNKTQLGEYIGSLTEQRINQILAGMQFLQSMTERREISEEK
jgi:mRNA interferase MazF